MVCEGFFVVSVLLHLSVSRACFMFQDIESPRFTTFVCLLVVDPPIHFQKLMPHGACAHAHAHTHTAPKARTPHVVHTCMTTNKQTKSKKLTSALAPPVLAIRATVFCTVDVSICPPLRTGLTCTYARSVLTRLTCAVDG